MKVQKRSAVSPIIATLLLIAIAVASGIVVYVFTAGLAGSLTKSGGNQVTEQISLDAYNYATIGSGPTLYVRNTGSSSVTMNAFYFNGATITAPSPDSCSLVIPVGGTCTLTFGTSPATSAIAGSSNQIRIISTDGGTFSFNVVAGQTG